MNDYDDYLLQLSHDVPKDHPELVFDFRDIAIYPPQEGTRCQIYGWSLTTRVRIET